MGLYDRHYVRDDQPRRGPASAMRMLSVNTWLIIVCVGVYLLDNYVLPLRLVPTGRTQMLHPDIPPEMVAYGRSPPQQVLIEEKLPGGKTAQRLTVALPLVERNTTTVVGWGEVMVMRFLESYLHFSTRMFVWPHVEFWRLIGFQFLHAGFSHLFFNMLGLFF